jgi:signal peptide peptidase SppA
MYAELLRRQPWAILESYLPLVARVLARLERGDPMSAADREAVESGREQWAARRRESTGAAQGYAGDVAIIGVYGVLTQRGGIDDLSTPTTSSARLASTIRQAAADPSISAIVLDVDSPGGQVYGIEELGNAIYEARSAKPIAAVANSLAASAAYWAASQASEFYAAPGAEVGSVGVYTMHVDYSEALKKEGIAVSYISAGRFKLEGNPHMPLDDAARAAVQITIDGYYDSFVRAVARGRGTSLKAVRDGMGEGRVLLGDAAKRERMIDGTATLAEVVSRMAAKTKRGGGSALSQSAPSALARAQREVEISELELDL